MGFGYVFLINIFKLIINNNCRNIDFVNISNVVYCWSWWAKLYQNECSAPLVDASRYILCQFVGILKSNRNKERKKENK